MAQALLVTVDIPAGEKVLKALDDAGFPPQVCLWAYLAEYEDWRLILSSRKFDALGIRDSYMLIHQTTDAVGMTVHTEPAVMVLKTNDSLIKKLRSIFGKTASVEGMRIGGQQIGERFVEDGYVYRIR